MRERKLALVLGSTGCIGNNIVRACLAAGWQVRAFHRPSSKTWMLDGLDVERARGDLADLRLLDRRHARLRRGLSRRCLLPAPLAGHGRLAARGGGRHEKRARRRTPTDVGRLVYTSTLTTIGPPPSPDRLADERDFYLPGSTRSAYFESKWAMEAEAWRAVAEGLPVVIVNPTAVFGPWDVETDHRRDPAERRQGTAFPSGSTWRQTSVDARDVGRGHVLAAERGRVGQRYILGGENLPYARP